MIEKLKENKIIVVIAAIVLVVGLYLVFSNSDLINNPNSTQNETIPTISQSPAVDEQPGPDPLNASYVIENQIVTLIDGVSEEQIPNSSTVISTQVWGEPVSVDIEGSEVANPALIITQDPGGSGVFYYAAAAISSDEGYYGTNGILLGDRISPQSQEIMSDGTIIVNYLDRAEGAPMSDEPTEAVSRYFKIEGRNLVEVENPNN